VSHYSSKMKWWTVTNERGERRVYSAVTADEARTEAKNHNPAMFGEGTLTAEIMGSTRIHDISRRTRKKN
jgi:hypothetical protein